LILLARGGFSDLFSAFARSIAQLFFVMANGLFNVLRRDFYSFWNFCLGRANLSKTGLIGNEFGNSIGQHMVPPRLDR
jgi:hypothetical protein